MLGAEVQLPPDIPRPGLDCPAREGHYFWLQQVLDELLACMAGMDDQLVAQFLALDDVKQLVPRCRQFEYSHARGVAQARSGAGLVDDRVVGSRQKHRQPAVRGAASWLVWPAHRRSPGYWPAWQIRAPWTVRYRRI